MASSKYNCKNVGGRQEAESRLSLINWINSLLDEDSKIQKVEDLHSGAQYCKILETLFPGVIQLNKVKFPAKNAFESTRNFELLKAGFRAINCNLEIPVDNLVKGKYADNYDFLFWFKKLYLANHDQPTRCPKPTYSKANISPGSYNVEKTEPTIRTHYSSPAILLGFKSKEPKPEETSAAVTLDEPIAERKLKQEHGSYPPPRQARPGPRSSSVTDDDEMWRQRRKQHTEEMAMTVERARQRRAEEEKHYEQSKQCAQEKAKNFEKSDKHGSYPPPRQARPGPRSSSVTDDDEMWRQRRKQHTEEMAMTVERARQRRAEEEKHYEQSKQCAQEKAKNFEKSDKHGSYPPPRQARPGPRSSSVTDDDEMWRQRRKQHTEEMAMTVERARQRRAEEEKHYEQSKQCAQEKAKNFEKSDKDGFESPED